MSKIKYTHRACKDEEIQTVVDEVKFLMDVGYRPNDKNQILEGLDVALEGATEEEWARWSRMWLQDVIEDFNYLGTP